MRFPTRGTLALALAACAFSPAAVHAIIPPRQRLYGDTIVSHFGRRSASGARSLDCSREAIEDCMDATSNDATTCFGRAVSRIIHSPLALDDDRPRRPDCAALQMPRGFQVDSDGRTGSRRLPTGPSFARSNLLSVRMVERLEIEKGSGAFSYRRTAISRTAHIHGMDWRLDWDLIQWPMNTVEPRRFERGPRRVRGKLLGSSLEDDDDDDDDESGDGPRLWVATRVDRI